MTSGLRTAALLSLPLFLTLSSCSGANSVSVTPPASLAVQLGTETTLLTPAQRTAFGIQFGPPDGTLGVSVNAGTYTFFAASRSASTNCSGTPGVQGTYRFGGSLTNITAPFGCAAVIQPGNDPNAYTFDRDYAGGGPVLPVTSATGVSGLLHIYHGEYHAGTCSGLGTCFYASLGMAVSTNGGATFTKLGEIIQPYVTRASILNANVNLDIGGGTLLLADQNGAHIANLATANPANVFLYVFYVDRDPSAAAANPCNTTSCVAVARAQLSTVVAAAFANNAAAFPTLFQKYYQGTWTQPATSSDPNAATNAGHYTPVVAASADFPTIVYDNAAQQYLMAYGSGNDTVTMVYGATLLNWSAPIAAATITSPGAGLVYPTLIGETADPTVSNGSPYLYYVHSPNAWPDWPDANVVYRQLTLTYH